VSPAINAPLAGVGRLTGVPAGTAVVAVLSVASTVGSSPLPLSNTWVAPNTSTTTSTTPAAMVHRRRVSLRWAS